MSADEGRLEDIRDYIVKKGLDGWNLYLGIKEDGSGKAAWLLPEATVISLLVGGDPEQLLTETLIDERTEVIYPALAPLPVGAMFRLEADPVRRELWVYLRPLSGSEMQGATETAEAIIRALSRTVPEAFVGPEGQA